jgi:hypothetical protein
MTRTPLPRLVGGAVEAAGRVPADRCRSSVTMSAKERELIIPPAAERDSRSIEMLRLWAANGELHVTIESGLEGGPEGFGEMLVDLARHGALLYSERDRISPLEALRRLREGFDDKWSSPLEWPTGRIPPDGEDE